MTDNDELARSIHYYKNGHSLSLDEHIHIVPKTVNPRSALLKRANSMPKMPNDTSFESVQEDINRKLLHKTILSKNPAAFRRTAGPTSCAKYASQKHAVRHLLPDIHPVSDPKDISPPKFGYNFTKVPREQQDLRTNLEDFLQPQSQVITRKTGYSKGHIRTVLELDTFGPHHSEAVAESRSHGCLPLSPNIDRNATSPLASRPHSPSDRSGVFSRSGVDSRGGADILILDHELPTGVLTGPVKLDLSKSASAPLIGTVELHGALSALDKSKAELVEITLPRPSTAGFNADPRGYSLEWTKRRQEMLKTKKEQAEKYKSFMEDKRRQQREAEEINTLIDTFEINLKSTKSYL